MPVSFILSAVSASPLSRRSKFCGNCERHDSGRRTKVVARRPRVRLPAAATASSNPVAGRPADARALSRNGNGQDALVSSQVGSTAFSAGDARNSLLALGREYLRLASQERFILWRLIGALALVFLSKFITLLTPFLYRRAVDTLTIPSASLMTFASILVLHCLAKIAASVTRELRNGVFVKAGVRVGRRVTALSFAHILGMEAAFHGASQTGALTRIVDRGTRSILTILRGVLFSFLPTILELILVCCVLFTSFSGWYVVATMITFALYLKYTFVLNNRMGLLRKDMNAVENETSAKITDSFFNFDAVTAFDNSLFETRRYDDSLQKSEKLLLKNEWLYVALNVGQNAIFMVGLSVMLLMCGRATLASQLTVGSFAMLSSMLYQLWQPLSYLGWQYREVKQSLIDLQNLFQLLQRQPAIQDSSDARELAVSGGKISFEDVYFTYPEESELDIDFIRKPSEFGSMQEFTKGKKIVSKSALSGITFTVEPGKSLALVGSSGSGKSSTLRLLYRLYDVSNGRILIDGQDISKVSMSSLRQSIGIVPQVCCQLRLHSIAAYQTLSSNILFSVFMLFSFQDTVLFNGTNLNSFHCV